MLRRSLAPLLNRPDARRAGAEVKVLFVCMGNICRSPTAQGVLEQRLAAAGLQERVYVDSAGTHGFHQGAPADARARQAAARRGIELGEQKSRRITEEDFAEFDYVIAMDHANLSTLRERCPPEYAHKLSLMLQFLPDAPGEEVPDPYYGGSNGFERVLDLVEQAADGLLEDLRRRL